MKEIVKEHPLRPIILRFDFEKPQSELEKKGLASHYLMHDLTWDMQKQLKAHYEALEKIDMEVTALEFQLLPIEQEMDIVEVFLNIKPPSILPFDERDEDFELNIEMADLYKSIIAHSDRLEEVQVDVTAENNWYQEHFDMIYEKESWIDEELWDNIHQIYRNYEQVQVDIVALDRDQEEFKEVLSEVFDYQDLYAEYGEAVFEMYNSLIRRADKNYRRAEAINKHINKL